MTFTVAKFICLSFLLSAIIVSCSNDANEDDTIRGCTDASAINYNPDADESDGSCAYSRSQYLGDYLGSISCDGVLGGIIQSDSLAFSLLEGFDLEDPTQVRVVFENSALSPVPLTANTVEDTLFVDQTLQQFPLEIPAPLDTIIPADITAQGFLLLVDNDSRVEGILNLSALTDLSPEPFESSCPIEADRVQ